MSTRKVERARTVIRDAPEEIGGVIGVNQSKVSEKLSDFSELEKGIKNLLASGLGHKEVTKRHNLPIQVMSVIDLAGLSEQSVNK